MNQKAPWYQKESMIFVAFLCAGPLMLPMVWLHPKLSISRKVLWTTGILVATYFLVVWMGDQFQKLGETYRQLQASLPKT